MDLGIAGKTALVCAASKGLGRGCALALAKEGAHVTIVARGREALQATAAELEKVSPAGTAIAFVAADITTAEGRAAALAACPQPDILVNNAGGPPPGDFREWMREDWIKALDANMLTPIELIKATVDGMIARRFGRIVNITSGAVKAPIDVLGLSNGARAASPASSPGWRGRPSGTTSPSTTCCPASSTPTASARWSAARPSRAASAYDEALAERIATIPAGRIGDPEEFGAACAYLCSAQAGFITGQNWLLDGGAYPGTF
jgi:3-oxoacyl-[acyl-carrier protein] reductase